MTEEKPAVMNVTRTPGPWTVEVADGYITGHVISPLHDYAGNTGSRRDSITDVNSMTKPDAYLLAASPELLEACEAALKALPCLKVENWPPGFELKREAIAKLKAAIAKAEGR